MKAEEHMRQELPQEPARGVPAGRLAFGSLLVALGAGWLLEALDVIDIPWDAVAPAALIAVGLGLLATRARRADGLVALGIILTVVSLIVTTTDATVGEGAGERVYRPDTFAELQSKYELGVGQLVVDLTAAEFPQATAIEARLGMGDLTVRVPAGIGIDVTAEAGIGDVNLFGEDAGGFGVERHKVVSGEPMLDLDVSVGIGSIEVTR